MVLLYVINVEKVTMYPSHQKRSYPPFLKKTENSGLVITSAAVATKNTTRAISHCLFNELVFTFFKNLHFGWNNDKPENSFLHIQIGQKIRRCSFGKLKNSIRRKIFINDRL